MDSIPLERLVGADSIPVPRSIPQTRAGVGLGSGTISWVGVVRGVVTGVVTGSCSGSERWGVVRVGGSSMTEEGGREERGPAPHSALPA